MPIMAPSFSANRPRSRDSRPQSRDDDNLIIPNRTSSLHSHQSLHRPVKQQTPPPVESESSGQPEKDKETVAEAVHDLADKADRDAREALARAEQGLDRADLGRDWRRGHLASEHEDKLCHP